MLNKMLILSDPFSLDRIVKMKYCMLSDADIIIIISFLPMCYKQYKNMCIFLKKFQNNFLSYDR
jgi:hypothetical protein